MLSDDVKVVVAVTTTNGAAGTSAITSAAVDTQGYRACCFVVALGPIVSTAVTSLKVQQSSDDAASDDYTDVKGTAQTIADTDDDGVKYVDILRPGKRYLKLLVSRGTANATVGSVLALLYNTRSRPVTQAATVVGEQFVTPIEGTA